MMLLSPQLCYWHEGFPFIRKDYKETYLMNAWLTMRYLEQKGVCSHPERQTNIEKKLEGVKLIWQ